MCQPLVTRQRQFIGNRQLNFLTKNKQVKNMSSDKGFAESLREALRQNWGHARHQEIQRQHQLYVYMLLFSASLTFMFSNYVALHLTLQQFWPVFLFLALYSFFVSSSVAKWNLEFKNFIKHTQWISEKLKLITPISEKRRTEVMDSNLTEDDKDLLLKDSMCQGYMALALPLPKKVSQNFENILDVLLLGTTIAFVSGLIIYISNSLFSLSTITVSGISFPFRLVAYPVGLFLSLLVVFKNRKTRNNMKENAEKVLDTREPDEISLRYRAKIPFYDPTERKKQQYHK